MKLYLRETVYVYGKKPEHRFEERLRLSVPDARELVTMLNHMIEQADDA